MPREEAQVGLMPSLLDRLTDPTSGGTAWRRGYGVEQMVEAVRRDLEDLLNTRQTTHGLSADFPETLSSVIGYGLPDLTTLNSYTTEQRGEIGRLIEQAVAHFEPRLKGIQAIMIEDGGGLERTVKFRIDARLSVDPAPEVAFDTVLELTTGHYLVKPTG